MRIVDARKQPVQIQAVLLTDENAHEVMAWINGQGGNSILRSSGGVLIASREGSMVASPDHHYIIRGVEGEFYPCEVAIFDQTYEIVGMRDA